MQFIRPLCTVYSKSLSFPEACLFKMDIAPFFFCVFYVDLTFGSVKKELGQYPNTLTSHFAKKMIIT